jgi:RNA polymerase sigma-70 factor (ECF subfamily)
MDESEFLDLLAKVRDGEQARERLLEWVRAYFHSQAERQPPSSDPAVDVSDLVHDAALVVVRNLGAFHGQSLGEFWAWLREILSSRLANAHRDATRLCRDQRRNVPLDDADPLPAQEDPPSSYLRQEEDAERLRRELARLPQKLRLIFHLRNSVGLKSREIAGLLDESESNVRSLFQLTVEHLKQRLGEVS